jgi:hypothetical protein
VALNPTSLENKLVTHLKNGTVLDLRAGAELSDLTAESMAGWGDSREIRAEFIREVLRGMHLPTSDIDPRGLRILGARITGTLDIDHLITQVALRFYYCQFTNRITAVSCDVPYFGLLGSVIQVPPAGARASLDLTGAHIRGDLTLSGVQAHNPSGSVIYADNCIIDGDAFFNSSFRAEGAGDDSTIRFLDARIQGQLAFGGAALTNPSGPALACDGLDCGQLILSKGFTATASSPQGAVRLPRAHLRGQLNASRATVINDKGPAFVASGAQFDGNLNFNDKFEARGASDDGAVHLMGSRVGRQLDMGGAKLTNTSGPALVLDDAHVSSSVFLSEGFVAIGSGESGCIRLAGTRISGQFGMSGADITNHSGPALACDALYVGMGMFADDGFIATGHSSDAAIRLHSAHIEGQLNMVGASIWNQKGTAILADAITVKGDMFLSQDFSASGDGLTGAIRLIGARVSGQLVISDAVIRNPSGAALIARGARIEGGIVMREGAFFYGSRAAAVLNLTQVSIGGNADMSGVEIRSVSCSCVSTAGARITGNLVLQGDFESQKLAKDTPIVNLQDTQITGTLRLDQESVALAPLGSKWDVNGLIYKSISGVTYKSWLTLIKKGTHYYSPQPYQQLAQVARLDGHDNEGRRSLISQRNDQLKRGGLSLPSRLWLAFTWFILGYGYQPWKALIGVVIVLTASVTVGLLNGGAFREAGQLTGHPCATVQVLQIVIDAAIPLVRTSTGSVCKVTASASGQFVSGMSVAFTIAGWLFTALFAAGLTRAIRQP